MKKSVRVVLLGSLVFAVVFYCSALSVSAADYPSKNIRFLVGYAPGGGFDTYARAMARVMEKLLPKGIHVVVENRPGAASQIATSIVYNANPDGYMMAILPMPGLYVPQMFFQPKYDVAKMTWLGTVLKEPMVLAVPKGSKYKTLKALQQADVVRVTLTGFTGPEIADPIAMEKLGIKAKYITGHKGSKAAMLAALRGDGDAVVYTYGSLRSFLLKGSFIPVLLMGSESRIPEIKDVPTATEAGYPDLDKLITTLRVIGAPPGLSGPIADKLKNLVWKTLNDPEFVEWSKKAKRDITPMDGEATHKAIMKLIAQYQGLEGLLKKYIK